MPHASKTPLIGGSALPYGVMMRAGTQVAVAVRRPDDEQVQVETFPIQAGGFAASGLGRLPFVRSALAVRQAASTGRQALEVMGRLTGAAEPVEGSGTLARVVAAVSVVTLAALQVAVFRIGPIVVAKEAGLTGVWFLLTEAALRLVLLIGALRLIALTRPARLLLAYHGAEHMAIAAHEAGRELSVASASVCSRFHRRCGTSFLVGSSLISVLIYGPLLALPGGFTYPVLIATRLLLAPVVAAVALEGQRVVADGRGRLARALSLPGLAAQRLTTASPSPAELEVAIASLEAVLKAGGAGLAADDMRSAEAPPGS